MSVGGFFKALGKTIWSGVRKILPFLGDALDNPAIKLILISKLGQKAVDLIMAVVAYFDDKNMSNEEKHVAAREKIMADFVSHGIPQPSNSDMDIQIKMAVKKLRGEGELMVPKEVR